MSLVTSIQHISPSDPGCKPWIFTSLVVNFGNSYKLVTYFKFLYNWTRLPQSYSTINHNHTDMKMWSVKTPLPYQTCIHGSSTFSSCVGELFHIIYFCYQNIKQYPISFTNLEEIIKFSSKLKEKTPYMKAQICKVMHPWRPHVWWFSSMVGRLGR